MDERTMSLGEHLVELRRRILISLGAVLVLFVLIFFIFEDHLLGVIMWPLNKVLAAMELCEPAASSLDVLSKLQESGYGLKEFSVGETFLTTMKIAFVAALAGAVPIWLYQLWMFVAPGLKSKERRAIFPALLFGTVLFALGVMMAYFITLPIVTRFFYEYAMGKGVVTQWRFTWFVNYALMLMLAFGIAFELPLVLTLLTIVGVVTPQMLQTQRKYAILIMFIAAAVLTPPDVTSQILLAAPLVLLYEISIVLSKIFYRRRWKALEEGLADEG